MKLSRRGTSSSLGLADRFFSYLHRRSAFDRTLFGVLLAIFVVSGLIWLWQYGQNNQQLVPTDGGTLHEGVIGSPRFVNPVLAITRADQDMVNILYRGLYTIDETGNLVPDLAESIDVSEDGRVYNIRLKTDATWHDGVNITADDVIYTIGLVQNPELKSPLRGNWNDVTIKPIDTYEFNLVLEDPYAPFEENLTLGILPRHLWEGLSTDEFPFSRYNTEPIGSGAYAIASVIRNDDGLITRYELERFAGYPTEPNISDIAVHFFATESEVRDALEDGTITHTAALEHQSVAALEERFTVYAEPLPRVFALYPNQNRSAALRDVAARQALSQVIDREALIEDVLGGYGAATNNPLPAGFGPAGTSSTSSVAAATETLLAGGWVQTEAGGWEKSTDDGTVQLAVTITTTNSDLFADSAEFISSAWQALGVDVSIAQYEQADLVQAVIRPRDYELLLFGTDVGRALDLYPFWHSSQREDPGLNVALYTNISTDTVLESYRVSTDPAEQATLLEDFTTEIATELPAIFLFTPEFTYVTSSDIPLTIPDRLNRPSERFATVASWHIESESLWPIFID